ncbi:uncharacterized protein LOC114538073 [Dendronephthya gigantea]|uniref:uncharacterized protein LOC114538073 n=1 Tax=Dendronephthya gigantea TaxID=151771 RepID=UPI0010692C31|nr:uncharacterized protein LOC114538073 [Dendronephthya gigantea]
MEVLTKTDSAFAHRRKLRVITYDSPAFRDQPGSEAKKRNFCERYHIQVANNGSLSDGKVPYTANEIVNACYARIWRSSNAKLNVCCDEPGIEDDSEMHKAINLGKDLDKLQKLRIKSRRKSRKCLDNNEVKDWIEGPEKFIDILAKLRGENSNGCSDNGSMERGEELVESDIQTDEILAVKDEKKRSNQVHFPEHVLLCAALQEGDYDEVEKVIKTNNIDLNSLIETTGNNYLHKTILNDQLQCARTLIRNGVDVNAIDSEGVSPLALAFRLMNFTMVALLVHSGADVGEYTSERIQEINQVKDLSGSVSKVFEMEV